jgi:hypothetical protein
MNKEQTQNKKLSLMNEDCEDSEHSEDVNQLRQGKEAVIPKIGDVETRRYTSNEILAMVKRVEINNRPHRGVYKKNDPMVVYTIKLPSHQKEFLRQQPKTVKLIRSFINEVMLNFGNTKDIHSRSGNNTSPSFTPSPYLICGFCKKPIWKGEGYQTSEKCPEKGLVHSDCEKRIRLVYKRVE